MKNGIFSRTNAALEGEVVSEEGNLQRPKIQEQQDKRQGNTIGLLIRPSAKQKPGSADRTPKHLNFHPADPVAVVAGSS